MISVLIVDDSVAVRRLVTDALMGVADVRVTGSVSDGRAALAKLATAAADVVLLDVDMPGTDSLGTVLALRHAHPELPIVMLSPPGGSATGAVLDALAAGANDVVIKPVGASSVVESLQVLRARLLPKVRELGGRSSGAVRRPALRSAVLPKPRRDTEVGAVAIGSVMGTTGALAALLTELPAGLAVPVLVAHAAPAGYATQLVERLDARSPLRVVVARAGEPLEPGTVYLAPAGAHLGVARHPSADVADLLPAPDDEFAAAPINALLRSMAIAYGPDALAVILAPGAEDGLAAAAVLRAVGAELITRAEQPDERWSAAEIVPSEQLAEYLRARLGEQAAAPAVAAGWR